MMRKLISTGSPFEKTAGYSRAVVQGDWCFVSGTTGYDYATMTMPDGVEAQTRNCLATIAKALADGGFAMADVVRAHYYLTDAAFVDLVFPILGEIFGDIRPAATMIICGLNKPEMKIEIEVTALRRTCSPALWACALSFRPLARRRPSALRKVPSMASRNLLLLPGDGIGPEAMAEVKKLIAAMNDELERRLRDRRRAGRRLRLRCAWAGDFRSRHGQGAGRRRRAVRRGRRAEMGRGAL